MTRGAALVGVIVLVLALVAAHLAAFGLLRSRLTLPVATAAGVAALAIAAHLGVLGPLGAWLRRHFHGGPD